jgi:ATP-binding cassette subfamily B protein
MTVPEALDPREVVGELAAFAILPEQVRTLVAESFEPVSFPFGAVIVREGEEADAFYVLASGSARVVKQGDHGEEVPLNVLHRGDSFGEMALLAETVRLATVRASSTVQALRLGKSVFTALTRSHPQVREAFQALATGRSLWNFFRVHSAFSQLSNEATALLVSELERVDVPAGEIVVREGDPPGPMYVIEEGRVRVFKSDDGTERQLEFLRTGDFFGERSLFRNEQRAASAQAVSDCTLLRFPPELFRRLL